MKASVFVEHKGYSNEHLAIRLEMTESGFDAIRERMRYQSYKIGSRTLYWACDEESGFVEFFAHDPSDEVGYGGRIFKVTMQDGSKIEVKGPWSSRNSIMNLYFPHSIEVTITTGEYSHYAGSILVEKAGLLIPGYKITTDLAQLVNDNGKEIEYVIAPKEV